MKLLDLTAFSDSEPQTVGYNSVKHGCHVEQPIRYLQKPDGSVVAAGGQILINQPISPDFLNGVIQSQGALFERFKLQDLMVNYRPSINVTQSGQLMMFFIQDPNESIPDTSTDDLLNFGKAHGGVLFNVSDNVSLHATRDNLISNVELYTGSADETSEDVKLHVAGRFLVVSATTVPSDALGTFSYRAQVAYRGHKTPTNQGPPVVSVAKLITSGTITELAPTRIFDAAFPWKTIMASPSYEFGNAQVDDTYGPVISQNGTYYAAFNLATAASLGGTWAIGSSTDGEGAGWVPFIVVHTIETTNNYHYAAYGIINDLEPGDRRYISLYSSTAPAATNITGVIAQWSMLTPAHYTREQIRENKLATRMRQLLIDVRDKADQEEYEALEAQTNLSDYAPTSGRMKPMSPPMWRR